MKAQGQLRSLLAELDKKLLLLKGAQAEILEFWTAACVGVEFPTLRQAGFKFWISFFHAAVCALDGALIVQLMRFARILGLVIFLA